MVHDTRYIVHTSIHIAQGTRANTHTNDARHIAYQNGKWYVPCGTAHLSWGIGNKIMTYFISFSLFLNFPHQQPGSGRILRLTSDSFTFCYREKKRGDHDFCRS